MEAIKQIEFNSAPVNKLRRNTWLHENKEKIVFVGEVRKPYRSRTKTGSYKETNIEVITIFYKEKP
jgi:hypothetical protein